MNTILIYLLKVSVYLAAFYIIYYLFLSNDTQYGRNRLFVLISVASSLLFPFIVIPAGNSLNLILFGKFLTEIFVTPSSGSQAASSVSGENITWLKLLLTLYFTGIIVFGLKLLADMGELVILILRNRSENTNIIRFDDLKTPGFSAFGYIFINSGLPEDESDEIIRHEKNHLEHCHSADIIFIELAKVVLWFNPFIYFFGRSLRAVHEYQADADCLCGGIKVNNYQKLLLNQIFKSRIFTISNSFSNPTLIKKRMIMMTKERSRALANLKLLMVVPVIATVLVFFSACSQKNEINGNDTEMLVPPPPPPTPVNADEPVTVVEEMPVFPGGEMGLLKFLQENIAYPENAKTKGIQGKVIVKFAVETDGKVDRVTILRGVDPELDKEALRVINSLPAFEKPGIKDGKAVAVWYNVPINFALQ